MIILGIETSCDETGCAILQKRGNRITILSNVVASSAKLQAKYGGIIPEQAAREQITSIIPVTEQALNEARITNKELSAIAVTQGPGLIGSLLVGVETAKTLALAWKKPLIAVNHLLGHFYANWIAKSRRFETPTFPCIGLLVSGGHTDLVLFQDHDTYKYLGGTRDDAAGECFDKCARLLDLPYPGGPPISQLAQKGDSAVFSLPRPMIGSGDFDFSFSGLKTAVANLLHTLQESKSTWRVKYDLAAAIEQAIVDVLIDKTIKAALKYKVKNIMVAGGVAANEKLRAALEKSCKLKTVSCKLFIPPAYLCTDNGAMIAAAAFFHTAVLDPLKLQADPNLSLY